MLNIPLFLDAASPIPLIIAGGVLLLIIVATAVLAVVGIVVLIRTIRRRNAEKTMKDKENENHDVP